MLCLYLFSKMVKLIMFSEEWLKTSDVTNL